MTVKCHIATTLTEHLISTLIAHFWYRYHRSDMGGTIKVLRTVPQECYSGTRRVILSILSIFIVLLWTNGHQKEPIFALLTADCRPGMLNGYAPEYVINVSG